MQTAMYHNKWPVTDAVSGFQFSVPN